MTELYSICVRVDDAFKQQVPTCAMRHAVSVTLKHFDAVTDTGLTLLITHDDEVQRLNQRYRGVDAPTDVLSFPAQADDDPPFIEEEDPYLGDILIALPYAARQAEEDGHDLRDVLLLLAVHGTLHLLGFDHDTPEKQRTMWAAQETLIKQLDVPPDVLPPMYAM